MQTPSQNWNIDRHLGYRHILTEGKGFQVEDLRCKKGGRAQNSKYTCGFTLAVLKY